MDMYFRAMPAVQIKLNLTSKNITLKISTDMRYSIKLRNK